MSDIVLRNVKGSPLTFSELDNNFAGLNVELFDLGKQIYRPIASTTALPGAPADGDLVELLDSTGVESSSAIVGAPAGFNGDDTLSVRLRYSSASGKWAWVDYASKAPDARYERLTIETAKQALAGLNAVEFTGVPSWAKKVTVVISGVSANANRFCVQLGTAGGYVTSGYTGSTAFLPYGFPTPGCYRMNSSTGFVFVENGTINGKLQIWQVASNLWIGTGVSIGGTYGTCWPHSLVSLTGRLTSLRLLAGVSTEHLGTGSFLAPGQTFTAGVVNVLYEGCGALTQGAVQLPGTPFLTFAGGSPSTISLVGGPYVLGYHFTVQTTRVLEGIGIYAPTANNHSAGIWDFTDPVNPVLVWSTNILSTDTGVTSGHFRWFSVTGGPALLPNVDYVIAATWNNELVPAGLSPGDVSLITSSQLNQSANNGPGGIGTMIVDFSTEAGATPLDSSPGYEKGFITVNMGLSEALPVAPIGWWDASISSSLTVACGPVMPGGFLSETVSQWNDISGNGWHLSQSNVSYRPVLASNAVNGRSVVLWPSSNNGNNLRSYREDAFLPMEIYVVAVFTGSVPPAANGPGLFTQFNYGKPHMGLKLTGEVFNATGPFQEFYVNGGTSNRTTTVFPELQKVCLIRAVRNPNVSINDGVGNPPQGISMGVDKQYGAPYFLDYGWQGAICEVIAFPSILSVGARATLTARLQTKWNVGATFTYDVGPSEACPVAPIGWWDASNSSSLTVASGNVSQWNDISGNGWHLSQSNASYRPALASGAVNGRSVVLWPSSNNGLNLRSYREETFLPMEIYVVAVFTGSVPPAANGPGLFTQFNYGNPWMGLKLTGEVFGATGPFQEFYINGGTSNRTTTVFPELQKVCLIRAVRNPNVSINDGVGNPPQGISMGVDKQYGAPYWLDYGWQGAICEVIAFPFILSVGARATLTAQLQTKWNVGATFTYSP